MTEPSRDRAAAAAPNASRAWPATAGLAAAGALIAWPLPAAWLDWQPVLAFTEPWRWWTAALVHWSPAHLGANVAGAAVVAALGWTAGLPRRGALAWAAAWPLTHALLLVQPALAHYGGLSGVLHAGVAVAALWLLVRARGRRRVIGAAIAAGLLIKVGLEAPWAGPLARPAGWDIAVAPLAHAGGVLAGTACAVLALAWPTARGAAGRR